MRSCMLLRVRSAGQADLPVMLSNQQVYPYAFVMGMTTELKWFQPLVT